MTTTTSMSASRCLIILALGFAATAPTALGKGFLVERKGASAKGKVNSTAFHNDIQNAIGAALGCGGGEARATATQLKDIEAALLPMWRSLPKMSSNGDRVERRSLRYVAHRYFMQKSSLMIRGFEPSRPANEKGWSSEDILSQQVPAYVESVLMSGHAESQGFGLQDAVHMIAMLEQLVFDSETTLLERVYSRKGRALDEKNNLDGLKQIFEEYIVHWMLGEDSQAIRILLSNRTLRETAFPHWHQLMSFVNGEISGMQFKRQHGSRGPSQGALKQQFSFNDAHEVVGRITKSFSSFWESECQSMKMVLVGMDKHNTGRVPLSKFYGSALDTEWRFGESEQYLRELGALDESSSWRGKQVIIPNYIQAASNCIVSTSHYLVCCVNDCESLLGEIETAVGKPVALPSEIVGVVGNMTAQTDLDDDASPKLEGPLTKQLQEIAAAHGGQVPLHGRLFAQWLHYVFPRDCPFPHKAGKASFATPSEYGDKYIATNTEMKDHAEQVQAVDESAVHKEDMQWMSQWSTEEELMADYSAQLSAPWLSRWGGIIGFLLLAGGAAAGIVGKAKAAPGHSSAHASLPDWSSKAHFV